MLSWIRRQYDLFCKRRDARNQERMRQFIKMANRPKNVERRRRKDEKEYGRLIIDDDGFHLLKNDCRELEQALFC